MAHIVAYSTAAGAAAGALAGTAWAAHGIAKRRLSQG